MEFTIHYRGKPFVARVAGEGRKPIKCTPVVCESWSSCGVGVLYNEGGGQFWGLFIPRNLIAAWRATEVLSLLDTIETGTLCAAYYTGVRILNESDIETYVNPIIAKIGQEAYNRVMAMAVPEQIIRAILDNQGTDWQPDVYPIIQELRAGTIKWRQEFDAIINRSNDIGARKPILQALSVRYEPLLASYARSKNMPRQSRLMTNVEAELLLILLDQGTDREHHDSVLVAFAGVIVNLLDAEITMHGLPKELHSLRVEETKNKEIAHSAEWLVSISRPSLLARIKGQRNPFTQASAQELLYHLFEQYFSKLE